MISCEKDGPYIGFSHCPVCSAKYATEMGQAIRKLETALAAMTAERDEMDNRVHIARTTIRNYQNIARELKDERDARDVAIRVLAKACANLSGLCNCESWCPARTDGKACTCGNEMEHAAIIQTINANPIARAAVEGER